MKNVQDSKVVTYRFRGTDYPLLFDLYAMEMIEDEFGSMKAAMLELTGGKQFKALRKLFRILANAAREAEDLPEDVTGNEVRRAGAEEMRELSDAIQQCFKAGKKTETEAGQEGSDERRELFEDEEDRKNG